MTLDNNHLNTHALFTILKPLIILNTDGDAVTYMNETGLQSRPFRNSPAA